ncbi:MAG: effector binding domain-containing protein [Methanobrevibacter sp.]|nr:effector binding domain-containing protein [Methanobrevibacter sp.]
MKMRFENRDTFKIFGYSKETNIENNNEDLEQLWSKHETELRKIPEGNSCLYGVIFYTDESHQNYSYFLGVELPVAKFNNMDHVEVPSSYFAVATVPKEMNAIEAWTEFFYKDISESGHIVNENHGIYFEFHDEKGNFELWTPVKPE